MRRFLLELVRALGLVLLAVLASAGEGCGSSSESCPASNCGSSDGEFCSGNQITGCAEVNRLIDDYGVVCPTAYVLSPLTDCAKVPGAECVAAQCVSKSERCPVGSVGFCRDGKSYACMGDRILVPPEACATNGLACYAVTAPSGEADGICAVDTTPCTDPNPAHGIQCLDNAIVTCGRGYPNTETPCEPDEVCRDEDYARCSIPAACPANGETLCSNDRIYGCQIYGDGTSAATPERLLDCNARGEQCIVKAKRALCSPAPEGLPEPSFVHISGGTFLAGAPEPRSVTLADFELLDREVTVADYAACVQAGGCTAPHQFDGNCTPSIEFLRSDLEADLPVTCVDHEQATAYCAWLGGRLPSGDEWEFAARNGGADVSFPWGEDAPDCTRAILQDDTAAGRAGSGCSRGQPWPGCARASDRTEQGLCDMVGNVQEWIANEYATRGADYRKDPSLIQADFLRSSRDPRSFDITVGVRCAR